MPADNHNFSRGNANLARKKRTQLGICFAALRRGGDPHLQRAVRQLARDFGFRTLRDYLHAERRHWPAPDPLFEELMHGILMRPHPLVQPRYTAGSSGPFSLDRRTRRRLLTGRMPPGWDTPLQ